MAAVSSKQRVEALAAASAYHIAFVGRLCQTLGTEFQPRKEIRMLYDRSWLAVATPQGNNSRPSGKSATK